MSKKVGYQLRSENRYPSKIGRLTVIKSGRLEQDQVEFGPHVPINKSIVSGITFFPKDTIFDWTKLKEFADDEIDLVQ